MSIDTDKKAFRPGSAGLEGGVRRGGGTVSGTGPRTGEGRPGTRCRSLWNRETSAAVYRRRCLKRRGAEVGLAAWLTSRLERLRLMLWRKMTIFAC